MTCGHRRWSLGGTEVTANRGVAIYRPDSPNKSSGGRNQEGNKVAAVVCRFGFWTFCARARYGYNIVQSGTFFV